MLTAGPATHPHVVSVIMWQSRSAEMEQLERQGQGSDATGLRAVNEPEKQKLWAIPRGNLVVYLRNTNVKRHVKSWAW